jgi:hypothetical protein
MEVALQVRGAQRPASQPTLRRRAFESPLALWWLTTVFSLLACGSARSATEGVAVRVPAASTRRGAGSASPSDVPDASDTIVAPGGLPDASADAMAGYSLQRMLENQIARGETSDHDTAPLFECSLGIEKGLPPLLFVYLGRVSSFESAPVYSVWVDWEGKVRFDGRHNLRAEWMGVREWQLSGATLDALRQVMESFDVFGYRHPPTESWIDHFGSMVCIAYSNGSRLRMLVDDTHLTPREPELQRLEHEIAKILGITDDQLRP